MQIIITPSGDKITFYPDNNDLFFGLRSGKFKYTLASANNAFGAAYDLDCQRLFIFDKTGYVKDFHLHFKDEQFIYLKISPNGKCVFLVTYLNNKTVRHRLYTISDTLQLELETAKDLKEKIYPS